MKSAYLLTVILLFLVPTSSVWALNPKSIDYMSVEITESGSLTPDKNIDDMVLSLYLPFNYGNLEASADSYTIDTDYLGNKLINLKWTNVKAGTRIDYSVKTQVVSNAHHLATGNILAATNADVVYLKQGYDVEFTDAVKEAAFPYKRTLERIAEMTE